MYPFEFRHCEHDKFTHNGQVNLHTTFYGVTFKHNFGPFTKGETVEVITLDYLSGMMSDDTLDGTARMVKLILFPETELQ